MNSRRFHLITGAAAAVTLAISIQVIEDKALDLHPGLIHPFYGLLQFTNRVFAGAGDH